MKSKTLQSSAITARRRHGMGVPRHVWQLLETVMLVPAVLLLASAGRGAAFRAPLGRLRSGSAQEGAFCYRARRLDNLAPMATGSRQRLPHGRAALSSMAASADHRESKQELLFVYGTLMSEKVLTSLLQRVPTVQPAILRGFHRFCIRDRPYPAIAAVPADFSADGGGPSGGEVAGLLLCGLSAEEHELLDYYEAEEYTKEQVEVRLCRQPHAVATAGYLPQDTQALGGDGARASAYVFAHRGDSLYGEWSIDKFLASDVLPGYIEMSKKCREDFLLERPTSDARNHLKNL
jgi:hypothetical protein